MKIQLEPFVNAEEIFVDIKYIESITKQISTYRGLQNIPYFIVNMKSGDCLEITEKSARELLKKWKK